MFPFSGHATTFIRLFLGWFNSLFTPEQDNAVNGRKKLNFLNQEILFFYTVLCRKISYLYVMMIHIAVTALFTTCPKDPTAPELFMDICLQ